MTVAINPFLRHTNLPANSGGDPGAPKYTPVEVPGLPPYDRVYFNPETKRHFKVRAGVFSQAAGLQLGESAYKITVAECDADGWALEWEHGPLTHKIAPEHVLTIQAGPGATVEQVLEDARLVQCAEAELRVVLEGQRGAIPAYPEF